MDDLISRRAVLVELKGLYIAPPKITNDIVWDSAIDSATDKIKDLPSVDAVEVVRCKDCKYFDGECCDRYADETLGYSHSTQPNFFCACGERKTDV